MPSEPERAVIEQVFTLYRRNRFLWDAHDSKYFHKNLRRKAYEEILKCYRRYNRTATMDGMKKKLENYRTTFRRELKKVQASIAAGGEIHQPSLWYYNYLSFLADDAEPSKNVNNSEDDEYEVEQLEEEMEDATEEVLAYYEDNEEEEPEVVKTEITCDPFDDTETFDDFEEQRDRSLLRDHLSRPTPRRNAPNNSKKSETQSESPVEAFGRSVAAQLKECDKVQRCIAEKLMSDVIFYAKLGHLSLETKIELNNSR